MTVFRTEFALEGRWYTNAIRFNDASEAVTAAKAKFMAWFGPLAWRVVTDNVDQKEPYLGDADQTAFRVTDVGGVEL